MSATLRIIQHQLDRPHPQTRPSKKRKSNKEPRSIDDLLIHITHLLNTESPNDLVVAVSGSFPQSISLVTVSEDSQKISDETQNSCRSQIPLLKSKGKILIRSAIAFIAHNSRDQQSPGNRPELAIYTTSLDAPHSSASGESTK